MARIMRIKGLSFHVSFWWFDVCYTDSWWITDRLGWTCYLIHGDEAAMEGILGAARNLP
jgi:hypothetical protein